LKNLVLSSILVTIIAGCSFPQYRSFQRTSESVISLNDIKPWFAEDPGHYLFHSEIDIKGKHFGGMMVIKYLNPGNFRVVYITEVGLKVFDIEFFANGDFKLHYCVEAINRKVIVKTLKNDIGLMLANVPVSNKIKLSEDSKQNKTLINSKGSSGEDYYLINNSSLRVEDISVRKNLQKNMEIQYFSNNMSELDSVRIKHFNIRLNIQLSRINESKSDVPEQPL
jgi:hypothetical protein